MVLITGFYAGILGLALIVLSLRVVSQRRKHMVNLGHGQAEELRRAMRVHGNFTEYVPTALILMALAEMNGTAVWFLHGMGLVLVGGRALHFYAITYTTGGSLTRILAMMATFTVLLAGGSAGVLGFLL